MDPGVYESLLTEHLHAQLAHRSDLHPDFAAVDDAEQALTIARYLAPLVERSLRSAPDSGHQGLPFSNTGLILPGKR